jgi:hypothetical protein
VRVTDPSLLGHDGDIAEQCDGRREADSVAVDGAHDRLVHLQQAHQQAPGDRGVEPLILAVDVATRTFRHRLDVSADAEVATRSGEQDGMDGMVVGQVVPDRAEFADQVGIERVPSLGAVQHHGGHLVRDLDRQHFIGRIT